VRIASLSGLRKIFIARTHAPNLKADWCVQRTQRIDIFFKRVEENKCVLCGRALSLMLALRRRYPPAGS